MKKKVDLQRVYGRALNKRTLRKIIQIWADEFKNGRINSLVDISYNNNLFLILRNKSKKIVGVGSLQPIKVTFLGKRYAIWGIQGVVSLVKRRGYGKIIMREIHLYLRKNNLTGVGFCMPSTSPFYRKCNFNIMKNRGKKFVREHPKKNKSRYSQGSDVVYLEGSNKFIKRMMAKPGAKVYVPHFW
jgi:hypothetical protein